MCSAVSFSIALNLRTWPNQTFFLWVHHDRVAGVGWWGWSVWACTSSCTLMSLYTFIFSERLGSVNVQHGEILSLLSVSLYLGFYTVWQGSVYCKSSWGQCLGQQVGENRAKIHNYYHVIMQDLYSSNSLHRASKNKGRLFSYNTIQDKRIMRVWLITREQQSRKSWEEAIIIQVGLGQHDAYYSPAILPCL